MAVRVEATNRTVAFAEDLITFFEERLDGVDQFFFVELFLGGAVGFFNGLEKLVCNAMMGVRAGKGTYLCDHLADWLDLLEGL